MACRGIARFLERRSLALALGLIAIATVRIVSTYRVFSFTIDEPGHFACGLEYLSKHVHRYLTEQPPLAQAAIALPPYLAGIRPLGEGNYNLEGRDVILQSRRPNRTLALMRLGILPFFWLACGVVYVWCRRHFAGTVTTLAVAMFTLLPPVLAHAGLACTDMALTACLGAAFLALVLWAESPVSSRWKRAALLGVAAALAALAKFTALLYLPAAAALALLFYVAAERPAPRKLGSLVRERAASFAFAALVGALVIWAGYWFSFGKVPAWNIKLPAPDFFDGLLAAQAHNRRGHPSYLLGHYSLTGWWYYFPVVLAVKTPLAFLVLAALGTYTCCRNLSIAACRLPLAFSLGVLLPAMIGHVDIGVRHILPVYIGLSILAAVGLDRLLTTEPRPLGIGIRRRAWQAAAIILLLWMAVSGAVCHPDYLSYFNEFAGREPAGILVDSNLDWGQDTKRLGRRLRQLGVQEVSVMLIEPLTLPLPTEDAVRRWYGLPRIKPVDVYSPGEGWNVLSPTIAETLGLRFKPWWERMPPTEKVGALWLYHIAPARGSVQSQPTPSH
jgi:4-amino-4-deoxy-L-arabinose transferase-like glycosyltransferase